MRLDYGLLSQHHRALLLKQSLTLYGLIATITHAEDFLNSYEEVMAEAETIYPEEKLPPQTVNPEKCKVLIDEPIEGLYMDGPTISLTDKLETQYTVTTDVLLKREDRLEVIYPDGRLLHLRIIERLSKHPFTTMVNKYKAIVM